MVSFHNKTMNQVTHFFCGDMDNMSYVISDTITKDCVIVDPSWDVDQLIGYISKESLHLSAIWITHAHFDHVLGLDDVLCDFDVPIMLPSMSAAKFSNYSRVMPFQSGDELVCGNVKWSVLPTPGHSADGVCFYSAPHLIAGDTLFIDRCGRADFEDSNVNDLYSSLQRLKQLPDDTIVYPGHNYGKTPIDTLGNQRVQNPYLTVSNEAEFIRLRMGR